MKEISIKNLVTDVAEEFDNIDDAIDFCQKNKFKDYQVDVTFFN